MKPLRLQSAIILLVSVLGISGCPQKKPVLVAPQQPPTTTAPQPTPTPEPVASQPAEQPQETQQPTTPAQQQATVTKPKPKSTKHPVAKKTVPPAPAENDKPANTSEVAKANPTKISVGPPKSEVPPSSTVGGPISPGSTPGDASRQGSTEQLLQSAEDNLNNLKRQLSREEEAMRAQIREFITQSHKAISENDLSRAHTLAVKARLLSDELVKQR